MSVIWRADPELLYPSFRMDVRTFLEASPFMWYVQSGYRSRREQNKLWLAYKYNNGPKAAPPGQSAHNYGLAVDVVLDVDPDTPGLQPSWDIKLKGWGWLKAKSLPHPTLQNGWSFNDWPHIQRFRWKRYIAEATTWVDSLPRD